MSPTEFVEWSEFERIEPSGPYRDNLHAGIIAQAVCASNGQPAKLSDFVLDFEPKDPQKIDADFLHALCRRMKRPK